MLALKLSREMERRLREQFGTTDSNPHAITLSDALTSLASLCLMHYKLDEKTTVTKSLQPTTSPSNADSQKGPRSESSLATPTPQRVTRELGRRSPGPRQKQFGSLRTISGV
jgi:hypothetical protein